MRKPLCILTIAGLIGAAASTAFAQWTSQTILLRPGWNAVFLEVQPEPSECDSVFSDPDLQIESVWRYNRQIGTVQFIDDPNKLVSNQPDWLTWLPPNHPLGEQSGLFTLEGGRPYLIKRSDTASATNWTVSGTPVNPSIEWLSDSLNLVGFPLAPSASLSFRSFLAPAPALATNFVYRLDTSGVWVRVNTPATTLMSPGEAFWVRTTGSCDYIGTLAVEAERRVGLKFAAILTEQTLRIRNSSTNAATLTLRTLDSDSPPPKYPALAGSVPLSYWRTDPANNFMGWTNLPTQLIATDVPPGGLWEIRLAVRRRDMAASSQPDALYQSLLEISDGRMRVLVPVSAEGLFSATGSGARRGKTRDDSVSVTNRAGLWIGSATLTHVNQPAGPNPTNVLETASAFQFRLLVHVDASGHTRLLQKVIQRWQDGDTNQVPAQAGRFVLLTDEALVPQYRGAALRDGQEVSPRSSSAAFGFREPILMTSNGEFGTTSTVCTASVVVGYNDPLNPFLHRYHPDHDNKDDLDDPLPVMNDERGAYTSESFTITRKIELTFSDADEVAGLSGWGDTRLGGSYRETIKGLHKDPLIVAGTFLLFKASTIPVLNE